MFTQPPNYWTDDTARVDRELKQWRSRGVKVESASVRTLQTPVGPAADLPICTVRPRNDIVDIIRRHSFDGPGDVTSAWRFVLSGVPSYRSTAILLVEIDNPAVCRFSLEFDIHRCLPFLMRCYELDSLFLTTTGRDPLREGIAITSVREAELLTAINCVGQLALQARRAN